MALTEYDKKKLSASDQNKILQATAKWEAANASGDKAGMEAAQKEAAAIRSNAGYSTNSDGTYKSSTGSSTKNSQYTGYTIGSDKGKQVAQGLGIGESFEASDGSIWTKENDGTITVNKNGQTYNNVYKQSDLGMLGQQQIAAGLSWQDVLNTYNSRYNKAISTDGLDKYANDEVQQMMWNYIVNGIKNSNQPEEFAYDEEKPIAPESDARIEELLNEILYRDEFSYDVMNDPLYQQYAEMYRREGDRAMRETLAEAAAGAGGMNTYAVTAAQQANSYYNSQLNDKVPELYQLAYQMYLNDIDRKVQDLGLLQNMDATQYARYRDTMTDWYNDRNFAYGMYQDDVQQGNWQANFDYNALADNRNYNTNEYWNNKNFENTEYWNNKNFDFNSEWKNKEWNESLADKKYERNQYAEESSKNDLWSLVELGVTPSDAMIEKAGLTDVASDIKAAAAAKKAELAKANSMTRVSTSYSPSDNSTYEQKKDEERTLAVDEVMASLMEGDMPDADLLNKAGITYETAWSIMGEYGYGPLAKTSSGGESGKQYSMDNYSSIDGAMKEINTTKGPETALEYLEEAFENGFIDIASYLVLKSSYSR